MNDKTKKYDSRSFRSLVAIFAIYLVKVSVVVSMSFR
jgi:hypothetical protein